MEIPLRLILESPTPGCDFAIQKGSGSRFECLLTQRVKSGDIVFDIVIQVSDKVLTGDPDFKGPLVQGPKGGRFIYIDVGRCAGQHDTEWQRRMKIPLQEISWALIDRVLRADKRRLQARIPGLAKDGGPNCATVKFMDGWTVEET